MSDMTASRFDPWQDDAESNGTRSLRIPMLLVLGVALFAGVLTWWAIQANKREALRNVKAASGRLGLAADDGLLHASFVRDDQPEIWYRVVLDEVPLGAPLEFVCEWTDADGRIAHRNRYRTKAIVHSPWETHARYKLPANSTVGRWHVQLLFDGRQLHSLPFEVK
jgi:hypothetical protein